MLQQRPCERGYNPHFRDGETDICRLPESRQEPNLPDTQLPVELTQRASRVSKTQALGTQGRRFRVIKNWSCPIPKGHLDKHALGRHD